MVGVSKMDPITHLLIERDITRLILDLGRCLDTGNFEKHGKNFIDSGVLKLPFKTVIGTDEITQHSSTNLGKFDAVYHTITDIIINIDSQGNTAVARANVHALHLFNKSEPSYFAEIGGYYNFELIRLESCWKFSSVELVKVWSSGNAPNIGVSSNTT